MIEDDPTTGDADRGASTAGAVAGSAGQPALTADLRVVLPAWATARVLVAAGYAMAAAVADHLTPGGRPRQLVDGLLSWDGAFYREIAEGGYQGLAGEPVRFFPLYPLLGRAVSVPLLGNVDLALVLVANVFAVVLAVLVRRLVLFEKGDARLADRAVWLTMLVPPAFVLVFAYAEALFLTLAVASFFALRRRSWWAAAALGAGAALARPFGLLLCLPAMAEALRQLRAASGAERAARMAAVAGPVAGTAAYLAYTGIRLDTWLGPYTAQSDFRGDLTDPVSRLVEGVGELAGSETFGDGLHIPFAVLALVLLGLTFRYWPVSYGLYAAVIVIGSLTADNLNSLERYALNAFPLVLTLAVITSGHRAERFALALCGGGIVALSGLALLGAYVP